MEGALDDHFKRIVEKVLKSDHTPALIHKDRIVIKRWVKAIFDGQVTIELATWEENLYLDLLRDYAFSGISDGHITNDVARRIIGLTKERPEVTQLSNLFRKWQRQGHVEKAKKRAEWKFLKSSTNKKN